jgi:hypothetical protein
MMIKGFKVLLITGAFLLAFACQPEQATEHDFSKCRYEAPEAIFSNALPEISNHQFEMRNGIGIEKVLIESHLQLTLIQEGCDYITQEFEFKWAGDHMHEPDYFWIQQSIDKFYQLGELGAGYLSFRSVAKAIESMAGQLRLNSPVELQPGVYLSIEPQPTPDNAILLITLAEQG